MSSEIRWSTILKIVLVFFCVLGFVVLLAWVAKTFGAGWAGLVGLFGGGGAGAVAEVKKRAKLKAKDVPDSDPDAVIDDISQRINPGG